MIQQVSSERDSANRQNDKLMKQNEDLKIYRPQDDIPLQKEALILASQICEFTKDWKSADAPEIQSQNVEKYLRRFGTRALLIRGDLDQNGQQSDTFDQVMFGFSSTYEDVQIGRASCRERV